MVHKIKIADHSFPPIFTPDLWFTPKNIDFQKGYNYEFNLIQTSTLTYSQVLSSTSTQIFFLVSKLGESSSYSFLSPSGTYKIKIIFKSALQFKKILGAKIKNTNNLKIINKNNNEN